MMQFERRVGEYAKAGVMGSANKPAGADGQPANAHAFDLEADF